MEKTEFETLMQAIAGLQARFDKTDARLDKRDAREDSRFEFIKEQIQSTQAESRAGFAGVNTMFQKMDARFDRIETKLDSMNEQLGKTHIDVVDLKSRVAKLEGPSA